MNHLVLYCRPGFEPECAAEIQALALEAGISGYPKTVRSSGYVLYITHMPDGAQTLMELIRFERLVFTRQWFACAGLLEGLPKADRISPLLDHLQAMPQCGELMVETADTNDAKALTGFCRKFTSPCSQQLRQVGLLSAKRNQRLPRLHLFFLSSDQVYAGLSFSNNHAPQSMGIPRLKFPSEAPSRSTLKLEEAILHFLKPSEREELLQPGMRAVDLGAAPGGWTWQLVRRHLRVAAVDNGPMHPQLMDSGLVEHVREDGFRYEPQRPVDWMVCDMADQPSKVAKRMALWLARGWSQRIIFNLKLPMKKRYQALCDCRQLIDQLLDQAGVPYQLDLKQLYHDREEVTGYLRQC